MKVLLKHVRIIDRSSVHHNSVKDVLCTDGVIEKIADNIEQADADYTFENICISKGWIDTGVSFGYPGYPERETLDNGLKVAAKSGFTQVLLHPDTLPCTSSQQDVTFIKEQGKRAVNEVFPIGAATLHSKGEHLSEMFEMKKAGAVAFGDYKKPFKSAQILKLALQYTQPFGGIIYSFAQEQSLVGKGVVNEHIHSTYSGLKGIPALAEYLCIDRDLKVLEYYGGKLHIPTVSCEESLDLIRKAKMKGLAVTCSVSAHHLHFTDESILNFDTNFKVLPPLRDKRHVEALKNGLTDGTIDFVTSDHRPMNIEQKCIEFDNAAFGSIGLESVFGILRQYVSAEKAVELLTAGKSYFSLAEYSIKEGNPCDITLFDPDKEYIFTSDDILSSSKNTMCLQQKMKGLPLGIITTKGTLFRN